MRTLLVLRHAKSSRKHPELADHDRPLSKRGKRDAPRMGKLIQRRRLTPALIISSTARRARWTADEVADWCAYDGAVHLERRLYLAGPGAVIDVARDLAGSATRVLVVGHNPGLEELIARLTGRSEIFPTAALARIDLPIDDWKELRSTVKGRLVNLWRPKELGEEPHRSRAISS